MTKDEWKQRRENGEDLPDARAERLKREAEDRARSRTAWDRLCGMAGFLGKQV